MDGSTTTKPDFHEYSPEELKKLRHTYPKPYVSAIWVLSKVS